MINFRNDPSTSPSSSPQPILSPKPVRALASDSTHAPRVPGLAASPPLAAPSVPSSLPLEPNASFPISPPDATERVPLPPADILQEIYFDDDALSSVEKIYLFARSKAITHRAFISRSLHTFLPEVSALEAVEYVLPLLNNLAVDEEEMVKEALVTDLVAIMWWFFENCQLVEDEPQQDPHEPPLLPVQTFTPILGSLLIDHNNMVGGPARFAVVEVLNRLRAAEIRDQDRPPFGRKERKMLEQEIIHQVIIGMGRLDVPEEFSQIPSPVAKSVSTSQLPPALSQPPLTETGLSTLSPPPPSVPTAAFAPSFQSTSTLPTHPTLDSPLTPPVPVLSPGNLSLTPESPVGPTSPPEQEQQPCVSLASNSPSSSEPPFLDWVPQSPHPTSEATFKDNTRDEDWASQEEGWVTAEGHDSQEDANEQAAVGRLSSMSLIATVTANATLPEETIRAFTDEVAYIGGDPLYWVRREASFAVGALSKVVPTELVTMSLLPLFDALVHDGVWHVRHSAIFALPGILARLTPQHRRALALETLLPLASDVAPTVQSGVLEVLGEVIYTFHNDPGGAPPKLVDLFVGRDDDPERRHDGNITEHWLSDPSPTRAKKPPGALSSVFDTDDDPPRGGKSDHEGEPMDMFGPSPAILTTPGGFFRDPARPLITSFNYPAVALSLGPRRWGELREYYISLTRDGNLRVRRTIAAGLGEMARIIGADLARRDLLDVWQEMVHDTEDGETRLKTLGGVSMFVGALEGEAKEAVVGGLVELWERWLTGWRERECLTGALPSLAGLATGQGEVVRTLLGKALVDNVAAVREAAIGAVSPVLRAFEGRPHLAEALRDDLQGLANADSCRRRATYVACYRELIESSNGNIEVVRIEFWNSIIKLSRDRVVDVRIGVARLLGLVCDTFYSQESSRPARLSEAVRRLGQDPSRDVRAFVAFLLVPPGSARPHDGATIRDPAPIPPVTFATFSRPPPRTPTMDAMVQGVQNLSMEDDLLMDLAEQQDKVPGRWPLRQGVEVGQHSAKDYVPELIPGPRRKENESKEQGEATNNDRSIPLAIERQRLDDWEPS